MFKLTEQQREALQVMSTRFHNKEPMTVIAGFAGTGKSSIINYFIEQNDMIEQTRFVTFTGKASLVLQEKGLPATTIHNLIYRSFLNKKTGKFVFIKKETLDPEIRLIVVDEVSMVPANLLRDLLSFEIPIVALGDPGQLEPIGENNELLKEPHYFLTEVHRQEEDSSIIDLSMHVRMGKPLVEFPSDENVKIVTRDEVSMPMLLWADQILCGRNDTRNAINQDIRTHLGYGDSIMSEGEKIICLRNYWGASNQNGEPLINGSIGTAKNVRISAFQDGGILAEDDYITVDFEAEYSDWEWGDLRLDTNILKGFAPTNLPRNSKIKDQFFQFDYGYAITTHKAQGSEFNKVLVFEERLGGNHARWLYTAVTRAADKIVIVRQ